MTAIPSTRHDRCIRFRMVEAVPEDEARDTLGKSLGQGPKRFEQHPLLAARYSADAQAVSQPSASLAGASNVSASAPNLANTYTPLNAKTAGDSSLNDLHTQKGCRPLAGDIADQIDRQLGLRFDPRFIEFHIDDEQFIAEAVALVQGGNGRKPLFYKYFRELESRKSENDKTPALTAAFNEIADVLLRQRAKPYSRAKKQLPFFYTGCQKAPQHNPNLRFLPGHGEDNLKRNGERSFSDWNDVKPDILVWKDPNCGGGVDWGRMASMAQVKKSASSDMRTVSDGTMDKSLLQLLKYLAFLAFENPVTGRTCGLSACGQYMRLVMSDSLSCSTTRLCDMMNPDHAKDLVLMVAFLLGPLNNVIDTFHPPKGRFRIKNPDGQGSIEYEWVPMREDASNKRKLEPQTMPSRKAAKGGSAGFKANSRDSGSSHDPPSSSSCETGKRAPISTQPPKSHAHRIDNDVFVAQQPKRSLRSSNRAEPDRPDALQSVISPWKILERRRDLWGRRTVALTGMARRIGTDGPAEPVIMKFVWSPPYLIEHELRVLSRLAEAIRCALDQDQGASASHNNLREALELVDSEVAASRPAVLGMLDGCDVKSRALPSKYGVEDGFEPDQSVTHVKLHLSAMCTRNCPGERIDETTPMTMQQRARILLGVFGSLWLAACSDIHYRDINTGNILFWEDANGTVHGFLIDYGNARELDKRRMWIALEKLPEPTTPPSNNPTTNADFGLNPVVRAESMTGKREENGESDETTGPTTSNDEIQLRLDDARSANIYFMSTTVHDLVEKYKAHNEELDALHTLEDQLKRQPDNKAKEEQIADLRCEIEQRDEVISKLPSHRYIDDLESASYAHIYQIATAAGEQVKPGTRDPAKLSIRNFSSCSTKTEAWGGNLRQTMRCINLEDDYWVKCITAIVKKIRDTRKVLNKQDVIPAKMTDLEHECFKDCLAILKSNIDNMGNQVIKRIAPPSIASDAVGEPSLANTM